MTHLLLLTQRLRKESEARMSSVVKEVYKIPLSQLEANEWNPNEQSDETFNELVKT